ncbi:MAG: DMT family transporter [Pseudomonadota bacterium]
MLHADSARNRLLGIGLISLTFLCFALLDAGAKWLVRTLPVVEVVWLRFLLQVALSGAVLLPRQGMALLRTKRPRLQAARAALLALMTGMNFWALQFLQLTEVLAIMFSTPLLIALLAAPLLGERLDAARWAAIAAGFAGVLAIVRPGTQGFHPALLIVLANALMYALFNLVTRRLAAYDSPAASQFLSGLGATLAITPFALAAWQAPPSALEWGVAAAIGAAGGLGHYLLALAHRYAPASSLAPFMYQQIVYTVALGYLVFGDLPQAAVLAGAAVVIASGLWLIWRERQATRPQG